MGQPDIQPKVDFKRVIFRASFVLYLLVCAMNWSGLGEYYLQSDWATWMDPQGTFQPPHKIGRDFVNIYLASCAALSGDLAPLMSPSAYMRTVEAFTYKGYMEHHWSYPPTWLTVIWPACFVSYPVAFISYMLATLALFIHACRLLRLGMGSIALIALSPAFVFNLWAGHNGYLVAALIIYAMHFRETKPVKTALSLTLLTIKPHLGFVFPLLFAMERRWKLILLTALMIVTWAALAWLVFGTEIWHSYFNVTAPLQWEVLIDKRPGAFFFITTIFKTIYGGGGGLLVATLGQAVYNLMILALMLHAWKKAPDMASRAVMGMAATVSLSPYLFYYDNIIMVVLLVLLRQRGMQAGQGDGGAMICLLLLAIAHVLQASYPAFFPGAPFIPLALIALTVSYVWMYQSVTQGCAAKIQ